MRKLLGALAIAGLALAGCSGGGDDGAVTVTSTVSSTSSSTSSSSTTTSAPEESTEADDSTAAADSKDAGQGGCVAGYTEAPGQVDPHCLDKTVASCGDPSLHQQGTTFFTDGTSGWTAQCAAQMVPSGGQGGQNSAPNYGADDGGGQYSPAAAEPPVYEEPSYDEPSGGTGGGAPDLPDGAGGGQAGY